MNSTCPVPSRTETRRSQPYAGEGIVSSVTTGRCGVAAPTPWRKVDAIAPGAADATSASGASSMFAQAAAGPFLALPSGATARSQRGHLERAYDDFISTGSVATVRPVVADSWRLSRASGVSPDGVLAIRRHARRRTRGLPVRPPARGGDAADPAAADRGGRGRRRHRGGRRCRRAAAVGGGRSDAPPTCRGDELGCRVPLGRTHHRHERTGGRHATGSCAAGVRPRALRQQRRRLVVHGRADPRPADRQGARRPGHHRPGRGGRTCRARAGPGRRRRRRDRAPDPGACFNRRHRPPVTEAHPGRATPITRRPSLSRNCCRCSAGTGRC